MQYRTQLARQSPDAYERICRPAGSRLDTLFDGEETTSKPPADAKTFSNLVRGVGFEDNSCPGIESLTSACQILGDSNKGGYFVR